MNRTQSVLVKILLSLFLLNTLSLCLYFSAHHNHHHHHHHHLTSNGKPHSLTENHSNVTENHSNLTENRRIYLKPWPILPSYLPWTQNPNVLPRSCEAYFGNGFTRRLDVLPPSAAGGWFRCFYSETLRSSVCEGGSVRMVPERVKMASGGERLEDVMGRGEGVELPDFEFGAFEVLGLGSRVSGRKEGKLVDDDFLNSFLPRGGISKHTMRGLVGSVRIVDRSQFQCDQVGKSRAFVFNRVISR